jgi:hypothetical protein
MELTVLRTKGRLERELLEQMTAVFDQTSACTPTFLGQTNSGFALFFHFSFFCLQMQFCALLQWNIMGVQQVHDASEHNGIQTYKYNINTKRAGWQHTPP